MNEYATYKASLDRVTVARSGITPALWRKIKNFASSSLYRINAGDADIYSFTIDDDGKNWSGGWSWSNSLSKYNTDDLAINLKDGKLYKLTSIKLE